MFNVCIKHVNKVLNCYKTYEVEEDLKFVTFDISCMFNV